MIVRLNYISENNPDLNNIRGWFVKKLMLVRVLENQKTYLGYWSQIEIYRVTYDEIEAGL